MKAHTGEKGRGRGNGDGGRSDASSHGPALELVGGVETRLSAEQQKLVLSVQWLVEQQVRELSSKTGYALRGDLLARGQLGAMRAASLYDQALETRFSSYAVAWIRGEILKELRQEGQHRTMKRAASEAGCAFLAETTDRFSVVWDEESTNVGRLTVLTERLLAAMLTGVGSETSTSETELIERECYARAVKVIRAALGRMSEHEQRIVAMRYVQEKMHKEIAEKLGMNVRTLRRHVESVLDRLREALVAHGITEAPAVRDYACRGCEVEL